MTNSKMQLPVDMTTEEYNILMEVCKDVPCKSSKDKESKNILHNRINQVYRESVINQYWD
ncbi:hypothetical protein G8V07_12445 [Clostridium botulinum D/C]|uniref:hypothetical protein n=1 Tax=Clostridium botulinum TaxID=1491 RepID=UPI0005808180|nr:hypothetical protein [Clostridium botulinum]MCD3321119.1 hypothetical protein [Clostridium botulinum D/C]MCD3324559.1 hypothetical protein [Clostridium botulinum D/C]MCD3326875.1 hypothetical protein [Clostridium botulinum D/C]